MPTYNRPDTIKQVLESLDNQTVKDFEVIVVDDGSNYDVEDHIKGYKVSYFKQNNSGPAKARNLGVEKASGELIAFIGDDTILDPKWVEEQLKTHKEKGPNIAVLGFTPWHKDLAVNEFMKYLAPNGPQFNYSLIKNKDNCGFGFFWTSNISLEKKWFNEDKFDEEFPWAAYEDIELSYRLHKKGLKIVYNEKAIANHYHEYAPKNYFEKQDILAKAAMIFYKKHPELKTELIDNNKMKLPHRIARFILAPIPKIGAMQHLFWKLERRYYFTKALKTLGM
ncbi:MAG: glycosyltransferase [Candidatus Pacearchaeota archaeon]|nr:glycosyltransferase [Candidatus Pacearchaeota archaeon]